MTTIKDIAKILVSQHKLRTEDAEAFISQITEVINEGLISDRQVKIKGFGTFKLQTVKERSSINVNTGERVIISEHDKVTFTPDSVMRDLVNKPFAQFETVIIDNDSISGEEIKEEEDIEETSENIDIEDNIESVKSIAGVMDTETNKEEKEEEEEEENVKEEKGINDDDDDEKGNNVEEEQNDDKNEDTTISEDKDEDSHSNTDDEKSESDSLKKDYNDKDEEDNDDDEEEEEEEEDDDDDDYEYDEHSPMFYYSVGGIICGIIFFIIGYYAGMNGWFNNWIGAKQQQKIENVDTTQNTLDTTLVNDTINNVAEDKIKDIKENEDKPSTDIIDNEEYSKKDDRVRTGAWVIVGTKTEVTVREGQTLKSISKAYLGDGMECYVEVYNDKKTVKVGDVIKIPELKHKKQIKK